MLDVYEYRQSGRGRAVALTAGVAAFCMTYGLVTEVSNVALLACCLIGVIVGWKLMLAPIRGIRLDQEHLTLNAWHTPRVIPLNNISFLRAVHWTQTSEVSIVYRDGTEESTNPRDLPDINTLAREMMARGVKVKDPGLID